METKTHSNWLTGDNNKVTTTTSTLTFAVSKQRNCILNSTHSTHSLRHLRRVLIDYLAYRVLILRCKIIQRIDRAQNAVLNVFRALKMLNFEGYLGGTEGYLQEPEDIPKNCTGPVWILGRCYRDAAAELEAIREDVRSRLWFTYRRCFTPVGSPQLTTDKGWGCMLRCGQMILAQTLVQLHLGRDWRWSSESR